MQKQYEVSNKFSNFIQKKKKMCLLRIFNGCKKIHNQKNRIINITTILTKKTPIIDDIKPSKTAVTRLLSSVFNQKTYKGINSLD